MNLQRLGKLGEGICEDLLSLDKEHWCKAYFRYEPKCDVVENNMCETFNSWIVSPRHKSIISMLEEIRHKIMSRNVDMRKFPDTWISDIAPMARVVLEGNKDLARRCEVLFNGDVGYEIRDGECRHIVNLPNRSCTCRLWMLKGIPCPHAICAFYHSGEEAEDYVEHWYRKDTFLEAFKCCLQPMPNMKMWPETNNPIIDPPEVKPLPGRRKRDRRREKTEPRKKYGKATKIGAKMTCSTCKQTGHNKKGCKTRNQSGVSRDMGQSSTSSAQHNGTKASATIPIVPMAVIHLLFVKIHLEFKKSIQIGGRGRGRGGGIPTSDSGLGVEGGRGRSGVGANSSATTASTSAATSSRYDFGATRPRVQGYGIYTDIRTGTSIFNQGMPSERVLTPGLLKNAADTNIDLGFRPHALKRKGKKAITTFQIQHHRNIVASARKKLKNVASSNDIE
ncbi:uncharacterized protein LOC132039362 [Lycium ferocissimum]|uniref:uncharacterized protein LOC132039362 n=1 Tax=Lycium ferocissimum TaxID=112874 RepID=UPI0028169C32|nr:uncharacterized protein LOC132039362 [Lycium ferocissimum]